MLQETSHSGSVPGSPHTRRPCSRASAMLNLQEHCSFILTTKQTDDARVDEPMFALIFTN